MNGRTEIISLWDFCPHSFPSSPRRIRQRLIWGDVLCELSSLSYAHDQILEIHGLTKQI